jgi:L-ribulose-5-phosphate 3-epimerase
MRKATSQLIFPREAGFRECVESARRSGYEGLEVRIRAEGELGLDAPESAFREASAFARDQGITICSAVAGGSDVALAENDPAARDRALELHKQMLQRAAWLGVDTLLVIPGRVTPEVSYDAVYERTITACRQLAPTARDTGVAIGIENVWNKFLLSPLEARRMFEEIGSDHVGLFFDVGNFVAWSYPEQWIALLGPRIKKVHFKDFDRKSHRFVPLMKGDVDWPVVMRALRDVGYDDWVISEVDGPAELDEVSQAMREILAL